MHFNCHHQIPFLHSPHHSTFVLFQNSTSGHSSPMSMSTAHHAGFRSSSFLASVFQPIKDLLRVLTQFRRSTQVHTSSALHMKRNSWQKHIFRRPMPITPLSQQWITASFSQSANNGAWQMSLQTPSLPAFRRVKSRKNFRKHLRHGVALRPQVWPIHAHMELLRRHPIFSQLRPESVCLFWSEHSKRDMSAVRSDKRSQPRLLFRSGCCVNLMARRRRFRRHQPDRRFKHGTRNAVSLSVSLALE